MIRKALLALAVAAVISPAHAQFSKLKHLAGKEDTATSQKGGSADKSHQEALVKRFVASQTHSLRAQALFAQAFGLAQQVQLLEAECQTLSSGSVNVDQMKNSVSVSESAQQAIDERVAAEPELTEESKKQYRDGLVEMLASAVEGRQLSLEASGFLSGLESLSPTQLVMANRKLATGVWIAKESPGYVKGLYSATKSALTFAKQSKINVPDDAEATAALGDI